MNKRAIRVFHLLLVPLVALTTLIPLRSNIAFADPPESPPDTTSTDQNHGVNTGDPISANAGAYHFSLPLMDLGGPLPLRFALNYRLDNELSSPGLLSGFQSSLELLLERLPHETTGQPIAMVWLHNGVTPKFTYDADSEQWNLDAASPTRYVLKETGPDYSHGYYYLMDPLQERVYIFEKVTSSCEPDWCPARIVYVMDRNGNCHTYTYSGDRLVPDRVEDGLGRRFDFTYYDGTHPLQRVTDQAGRFVQLNRELNAPDLNNNDVLRSVTDTEGYTTTFHYTYVVSQPSASPIVAVDRPLGNTPYTQAVADVKLNDADWVRVTAQTDAYSNTVNLAYDAVTNRVTETQPDDTTYVYEHFHNAGVPQSLTDATGETIHFNQSDNEQVTQVTDRLGDSTNMTYHTAAGKLSSYQDAEGQLTLFSYAPQVQGSTNPANSETVYFTFYDLTRTTYDDETHDDFTYDAHGNVITQTNRLGQVWTYTYNERGQLLTSTNPEGGVATYTYHADGTRASSTDSDVGITTYGYDDYKRLNLITRPDGSTVHYTYDLNDRLLSVTNERGKTTTYTYDANGNRLTATDPLSQTVTYAHDLMDREESRTDPLGHASGRTYDEMSRLETFTDRNGHTTTYTYDVRGWRIGVTDPLSNTWATAYDDEGVPTACTTPLGFTTQYQTDKIGRTTVITDPLGAATHFTYDKLERLTSTTDRVGRTTDYDYDDAGNLVGVTLPLTRTAVYTRNNLGLLTHIADLQGKEWHFGYSPMGRRTSHTDPLSNQWTYGYGARGRLQQTTYPGGGTATYTYDTTSNVTRTVYSDGPTLDFTYDDANRLLTANHITLTYDERGDVTDSQDEDSASFGATYDDGQRLKTVTYDGQATVTYTYNARDLLTRVEDDLSGAWMAFAYDDDSRLTEIGRSNGVSTTLAYDDAGRVTRIHDTSVVSGTVADQQYTLNAEGEPTQVVRTLPLDLPPVGQVAGNSSSCTLSYDDAAQISSPGYAYDARGRQTAAPGKTFAYDGVSRLTQIVSGTTTADLTYNGLDDLRTRTASGTTTTYYHNYAIGASPLLAGGTERELAPIVAEKEGASYKRLYVYTPDGALLYSIDPATNQARFYHFDRVGSALFLTDGGGAVSDAYAYDPYGNLLGHTGDSDQPFTYVGQYGVLREPVGSLYDMRARVYDPETARFLTRDPVWPLPDDVESLNPYHYAYQNPLRYVDPQGTQPPGSISIVGGVRQAAGKYGYSSPRPLRDPQPEPEPEPEVYYNPYGSPAGIRDLIQQTQQGIEVLQGQIRDILAQGQGQAQAGGLAPDTMEGLRYQQQVTDCLSPGSTYQLYSPEASMQAIQTQIDNAQASIRDLEDRLEEFYSPPSMEFDPFGNPPELQPPM
jgi:RHS repeat-associated protein